MSDSFPTPAQMAHRLIPLDVTHARSYVWIGVGAVLGIVYVVVLGRGIVLAALVATKH